MEERDWNNALDRIKLPREIYISNSEFLSILDTYGYLLNISREQPYWKTLIDESLKILISDNPDTATIESSEMAQFLLHHADIKRYQEYRYRFVSAARMYLIQVEQLRVLWRDHTNPYLTWHLSDDHKLIIIRFNPVYPARDYDAILRKEVNAAIEQGEFVPYKYLKVLGLC